MRRIHLVVELKQHQVPPMLNQLRRPATDTRAPRAVLFATPLARREKVPTVVLDPLCGLSAHTHAPGASRLKAVGALFRLGHAGPESQCFEGAAFLLLIRIFVGGIVVICGRGGADCRKKGDAAPWCGRRRGWRWWLYHWT